MQYYFNIVNFLNFRINLMSISFNLPGFSCLVTGGTKGIGRATVELLCESKAKVLRI